jgi:hypothetical protein
MMRAKVPALREGIYEKKQAGPGLSGYMDTNH